MYQPDLKSNKSMQAGNVVGYSHRLPQVGMNLQRIYEHLGLIQFCSANTQNEKTVTRAVRRTVLCATCHLDPIRPTGVTEYSAGGARITPP
jgi:hypothetical protein